MNDENLLLFVRDPNSEGVKTRLADVIGSKAARELYRCFLSDMLAALKEGNFPITIYVHPAVAVPTTRKALGERYQYRPQTGDDLGSNMHQAFAEAFADGCQRAVLIGSDLPDLPLDAVNEAFRLLHTVDCVIGPSTDGGYYLIGFTPRGFVSEAFSHMSWGSASVLNDTISRTEDHGRRVKRLPSWRDIDTVEDLQDFFLRTSTGVSGCRTRDYLIQSRLLD